MDEFTHWAGIPDHLVRVLCDFHGFAINCTALITTLFSVIKILDQDKTCLLLCLLH